MIDKNRAFAYFDKYHGPLRMSTNGWYDGRCPYCDSFKLTVHFDYLQVKCWKECFNREFIVDFIRKYEGLKYFEVRELIDATEPRPLGFTTVTRGKEEVVSDIELPSGYKSILYGDTALAVRARKYLLGRGFDLEYMDRIGVGYCNEQDTKENYFGYIIIPFKQKGKLKYFIGRDFIDGYPRYKNPERGKYGVGKSEVLFNEEALHLHSKGYITEGWTDASTIGPAGVSIQGNSLSSIQTSLVLSSPVKELVIALDVGYYKQGLAIARKLIDYKKVKVLRLDLLEEYGKDVNKLGKERILELERITRNLTKQTLYTGLRDASRPSHTYTKI